MCRYDCCYESTVIYLILQNLQGKVGEKRLGVDPKNPNVPVVVVLNGGEPTKQIMYRINVFEANSPKPEAFNVPDSCPKSSEIEKVHPLQMLSLAMPSLRIDLTGKPLIKTLSGLVQS